LRIGHVTATTFLAVAAYAKARPASRKHPNGSKVDLAQAKACIRCRNGAEIKVRVVCEKNVALRFFFDSG
jgi:hypothetical protein